MTTISCFCLANERTLIIGVTGVRHGFSLSLALINTSDARSLNERSILVVKTSAPFHPANVRNTISDLGGDVSSEIGIAPRTRFGVTRK